MERYVSFFESDTFVVPNYLIFKGEWKIWTKYITAKAIMFYLDILMGGARKNYKIEIQKLLNKNTQFGEITLNIDAINDHSFSLFVDTNASVSFMLKGIAHECMHIYQIMSGQLSATKDFSTILWKGKPIANYSQLTQKNYKAYAKIPFEKEAIENEGVLHNKLMQSDELKNLIGIDATLDLIVNNL